MFFNVGIGILIHRQKSRSNSIISCLAACIPPPPRLKEMRPQQEAD
jgi:hypothetical protein